MIERTTVRLPQELLRRAKRKAQAEGRTLTSLIEDGLRLVTDEAREIEKPPVRYPRISAARGGLLPGVTLKMSDLDEADDLDYAARMGFLK